MINKIYNIENRAPLSDILWEARSTQCAKPLVMIDDKFRTIEANYTNIRDGVIENVIEKHLRETLK